MSEASSKYLDVKNQYDKAKQDIIKMIATVQKIVNAIKDNPTREEIAIPSLFATPSGRQSRKPIKKIVPAFSVLAVNEWPDAKQVHGKLDILNDLFLSTHQLWSLIPALEKKNLTAPDKELRLQ